MKRCPECRRDYYDDTLSFCLDDGARLLEGPATDETKTKMLGATDLTDEPQTAILNNPAISEAQTKHEFHSAEKTEILPKDVLENPSKNHVASNKNTVIAAIIGIVLITALGIGSYWFYGTGTNRQIESIAVMPFVNESGNQDIEYLSDGMTDTLINSLSKLPDLNVKPRSTVFRYKGKNTDLPTIAKELNVQAILNGRVVQRGDEVSINLELIDTAKDSVIWSESYQRKQSELVTLQSEIARDISTDLRAKLSGAEKSKATDSGTTNPEAYEAFLKGRYYFRSTYSEENLRKAFEQFKIAVDKDPNYAQAYAGLGDAYLNLMGYENKIESREDFLQPKAIFEKALSLDPTLAKPHQLLAVINRSLWNWAEAEREAKRAIELEPNDPGGYYGYAQHLMVLSRYDEAMEMMKRAEKLDPMDFNIWFVISMIYIHQKNYQASIEKSLKILEFDPNQTAVYILLAESYLKLGRNQEALTAVDKLTSKKNQDAVDAWAGYIYASAGRRDKALAIIKQLEEKYSRQEAVGAQLAQVYAGLGEKDKAFEWLEKDFRNKVPGLDVITYAPSWESLRDDPRFKDLLKRMDLPE